MTAKFEKAWHAEVKRLRADGFSVNAICGKVGRQHQSVRWVLDENGEREKTRQRALRSRGRTGDEPPGRRFVHELFASRGLRKIRRILPEPAIKDRAVKAFARHEIGFAELSCILHGGPLPPSLRGLGAMPLTPGPSPERERKGKAGAFERMRHARALAPHDAGLNERRWLIGESFRRTLKAQASSWAEIGEVLRAMRVMKERVGEASFDVMVAVIIRGSALRDCRRLVAETAAPHRADAILADRLRVGLDRIGELAGVAASGPPGRD